MQESRNYLAVLTCLYSFFYKLRIKTIKIELYYIYWLPLNSYICP